MQESKENIQEPLSWPQPCLCSSCLNFTSSTNKKGDELYRKYKISIQVLQWLWHTCDKKLSTLRMLYFVYLQLSLIKILNRKDIICYFSLILFCIMQDQATGSVQRK